MAGKSSSRVYDKIDSICEDVTIVKISLGKIEEHLKGINGKVNDSQKRIGDIEQSTQQNSLTLSKIGGIGIAAGVVGSFVGALIMFMLGKVFA